MNDKIVPVDVHQAYLSDMARYSLYILFERYVPSIKDGLKIVHRRILYCMYHDVKNVSLATKRKSSNTVGTVMAYYHGHGDSGIYGACKTLTNWFEIKCPLINYDSNSGSIQGGPQSSARYTESYLSKFAIDVALSELNESRNVVDWQKTFDKHTDEPQYLPIKLPLLLINGVFAIAIGRRVEVPPHSVNDVIDATITLLHDPKARIVLIPDPCQKCEIVNTDWKKISKQGFGQFIERGIIETVTEKNGMQYLSIRSTPDIVTANNVVAKIEELIKDNKLIQISDIQDHSTDDQLDIRLYLKRGSDSEYVKQVIYKNTTLQDTKRVNMEVIIDNSIERIGYKEYLLAFLDMRKDIKFRLYNARLQKAETRRATIAFLVEILKSGKIEEVVHKIRNLKPADEAELVDWLMKTFNLAEVQARYVMNTQLKNLSKGNLNKYLAEMKDLEMEVNKYITIITTPGIIEKEIEDELLSLKEKYGRPRQSVLISEASANNIPTGTFKIIMYVDGTIKKVQPDDPLKSYKGVPILCAVLGENDKDIILFDDMGRAFKLPIHKIPFIDKNAPGMDIRLLLKKLTSRVVCIAYLPYLESLKDYECKSYIVTLSKQGYIKKIDIDDILNSTPSGIIYSKLANNDSIYNVTICNDAFDIIVYNKVKAIRISMNQVPYLKRATIGNMSIKSDIPVDGMALVSPATNEIIVVTAKGKFNRINQTVISRSDRNKPGHKVIKLSGDDYIKNIYAADHPMIIRCLHTDGTETDIDTNTIEMGSSVSAGKKMTKDIMLTKIL